MPNNLQSDLEAAVEDPNALRVEEVDVAGALFLIPFDAPLPADVPAERLATGSLYDRLAPLARQEELEPYGFCALSGAELTALQQAWKAIVRRKKVFALFDLPGARYDVLFSAAVRQIGIRRVDWPAVADAVAARARVLQRANDKTPFALSDELRRQPLAGPAGAGFARGAALPPADAVDEGDES